MITTLRTGALTLSSIQYKFDANKRLTVKITTSASHKIYGEVNIILANVKKTNIYDKSKSLIEDYFNNTLKFTRTGSTTLEYSEVITSGVEQAETFTTLDNNGTPITATVDNASIDLSAGQYNFLLLDTADSVFSGAKIGIKQKNIENVGVDGLTSSFDENGLADVLSINNQDLTFKFSANVSLIDNDANVTNIPLIITKNV